MILRLRLELGSVTLSERLIAKPGRSEFQLGLGELTLCTEEDAPNMAPIVAAMATSMHGNGAETQFLEENLSNATTDQTRLRDFLLLG